MHRIPKICKHRMVRQPYHHYVQLWQCATRHWCRYFVWITQRHGDDIRIWTPQKRRPITDVMKMTSRENCVCRHYYSLNDHLITYPIQLYNLKWLCIVSHLNCSIYSNWDLVFQSMVICANQWNLCGNHQVWDCH